MKKDFHFALFLNVSLAALAAVLCASCASVVPMQDAESDARAKRFDVPPKDWCGLYIYRDGMAFSRDLYVDGQYIGKTGSKTYFYRLVRPGEHWVQTGGNKLQLHAIEGVNHFVRQWVRMGSFYPETILWGAPAKSGAAAVHGLLLAADRDDKSRNLSDARTADARVGDPFRYGSIPAIPMLSVPRSNIDDNGRLENGGDVAPVPVVNENGVQETQSLLEDDGLGAPPDGAGAAGEDGNPS